MTQIRTHGRDNITATFQQAQDENRAALMPYFTLGFPDIETSLDVIEAIAPHSDLLELGVPFSDPMPTAPRFSAVHKLP
jgi:tryptophan synthase alpha chain